MSNNRDHLKVIAEEKAEEKIKAFELIYIQANDKDKIKKEEISKAYELYLRYKSIPSNDWNGTVVDAIISSKEYIIGWEFGEKNVNGPVVVKNEDDPQTLGWIRYSEEERNNTSLIHGYSDATYYGYLINLGRPLFFYNLKKFTVSATTAKTILELLHYIGIIENSDKVSITNGARGGGAKLIGCIDELIDTKQDLFKPFHNTRKILVQDFNAFLGLNLKDDVHKITKGVANFTYEDARKATSDFFSNPNR